MDDETVSMLLARLEIGDKRTDDAEVEIIRALIRPGIFPVYADCARGVDQTEYSWQTEIQMLCEESAPLLHIVAAHLAKIDVSEIEDAVLGAGIIKRDTEIKTAFESHVETLRLMVEPVHDYHAFHPRHRIRFGEFRSAISAVIRNLETVVELANAGRT
jgi:hypothetical protein